MESKIERQALGDVQPQRERRESRGNQESHNGQSAAFLKNAGESRDEEKVGEGFHSQDSAPSPPPCTSMEWTRRFCALRSFLNGIAREGAEARRKEKAWL